MTTTFVKCISRLLLISAALPALGPAAWALTPIEVAKLTASDGAAGDKFGHVVAVDGDTALIGAYGDDDNGSSSGSVYVFTRSGGMWTEQAKLTASDGAPSDVFGYSLALFGDTALIGAPVDDDNGIGSGSAYVFTRSGEVWTEQAKLTASDGAAQDTFGYSLALGVDTALIGAWGDDHNDPGSSGSAYVFVRSAGVWMEQAKLTASDRLDGASSDMFGRSVALDGDTALIAGGWDNWIYAFTRDAGVWTEQAKFTANDYVNAFFGEPVALDGDTALIAAPLDDPGLPGGEEVVYGGSAYVFQRSAGAWTQQVILTASDAASGAQFGQSLALDGDTALIGAIYGSSSGSAYVFTRSAGSWTQRAKLTASDAAPYADFGHSVALDGDTVLIGAPGDDDNGSASGSAYIFSLNAAMVVTIDIKPGLETNNINPNSNGLIAVAILTAGEFDALQVDPNTAKFGPNEATAERYTVVDVDRDGDQDLLLHFRAREAGIACADIQATLVGELYNGTDVTGTDSITTVGCLPGAVIEAESMALSDGYAVEDNADASGGQLIRRLDTGGQAALASTAFAGSAGVYDIEVVYFDERDGQSSLAFLLNGQVLDQWVADEDPTCRDCASPNERTLRTRVVARGIRLAPGDELTLQGTGDYYEYARFDNISLSPAGLDTLEAEDMRLDDGFVVEANAAASGGLIIRGIAPADSAPGKASAAFLGSKGRYDITVSYFDEYDGISSMAVFLNDQLLEQWLADENPACRDCASPNERTLRSRVVATGIELSPGDDIRLESTVNQYEYGRFDKVDFTRALLP